MTRKTKLLSMTALPLIAVLATGVEPAPGTGGLQLLPQARAQAANPCAPVNPCAPASSGGAGPMMMNPCAPAPANPCAPGPAGMKGKMALPEALPAAAANPFDVTSGLPEAPFGDRIDDRIPYYTRVAPHVATSGKVAPEGFALAAELGFKAVVNLLPDEEDGALLTEAAKAAGLEVYRLPVPTRAPTWEQVRAFSEIVERTDDYPLLVFCISANRAGAMWALYRASRGVPKEIAIQEGRAAGLRPSRERKVREMLGLPPLPAG